jgi:glycolate oxidase FAD binding subunit
VKTTEAALPAFVDLVGEKWVRDATAADAVAGVQPALVVAPEDEDGVAAVLRLATRDGLAVVVRGGGTKLDWGRPPRRCDVVLSTERLTALVEHEPADLICVVQAGMQLATLQRRLLATAGHRQQLMLDPPPPGPQTVGGVLACNAAGGRRTRYGTPRDLVIGARFVLADGTIAHSGGKVVKNVAGYDIARLLCGSLGTLAVITQAAFRLHPVPQAERTVVAENVSATRLAELGDALRTAPVVIGAADVLWPDGLLAVRVEGTEESADAQAATLAAQLGGRVLDESDARLLQKSMRHAPWQGDGTIVGVGVPRSRIRQLLDICSNFAASAVIRPCVGTAQALVPTDSDVVIRFRAAVTGVGGHLTVHRGGGAIGDAAFGDADETAVELMRAVTSRFDPTATLSPGRHLGSV